MNETPQNKRGWRILRRILITLAVLATLVAAFYAEEDWRGKRAWENYKHEWEAKGEKFDWQAFVPPSVPADQNFFCAPIFTNMLQGEILVSPYGNDGGPDVQPAASRSGYAVYRMQMTDLKSWQKYYRNPTRLHAVDEFVMTNGTLMEQTNHLNHPADEFPIASEPQTPAKDVLFALSKYDSAVEALRQASERPYANVPVNYQAGPSAMGSTLLPYLAALKRCTQFLQLRASAELADDQTTNALADVQLAWYLNKSLRSSPFLISHLVRIAIVAIDIQPIWEGLAEHKWSDAQLAALDVELGKMDFLADCQSVMRSEEASSFASIDGWRQHRDKITAMSFGGDLEGDSDRSILVKIKNLAKVACLRWMPDGWYYQNELAVARIHQTWDSKMVDAENGMVFSKAIQAANLSNINEHSLLWNLYARRTLPVLGAVARKAVQIQVEVDLARAACALERYRLAHGNYPESLDALVPQFIAKVPHDVINGQPLHYRRTDNGSFILYSVGWDEKDDGGVVGQRPGNRQPFLFSGDWVWKY